MQSIRETLEALAELARGIGLEDHARELERATASEGLVVTVPGLGFAPASLVLWVLGRDAGECFAELSAAGEAVVHVLRDSPYSQRAAMGRAIVDAIAALHVASMPAADMLTRRRHAA
jgi:hypothetical protein